MPTRVVGTEGSDFSLAPTLASDSVAVFSACLRFALGSQLPLRVNARSYFTTSVKKLGNVWVCPFSVVVSVKLYVPAGVAPFGPCGRLLHAADPNATSSKVANVTATRRLRRNIHAVPPSASISNSIARSAPPLPPCGIIPVEVAAP